MKTSEFLLRVGPRTITSMLAEPDDGRLAPDPALLLTFGSTRQDMISTPIYNVAALVFLQAGHRVLSFELPHHGERIAPYKSEGLNGFIEAMMAGKDSFKDFVDDGVAAIDLCIQKGLGKPGRIYLAGVSRGGYCVLRLAAVDDRVGGVAAYAPVMDWRAVSEFAAIKDRPDVVALALEPLAEKFVGKAVYIAIGNADNRVGTDYCVRFAQRMFEAEAKAGIVSSRHALHVVNNSSGHALEEPWRINGAKFLLELDAKS